MKTEIPISGLGRNYISIPVFSDLYEKKLLKKKKYEKNYLKYNK